MKKFCFKMMQRESLPENAENGFYITNCEKKKFFIYLIFITIFAIIKINFLIWLFRRNSLD